MPTADSPDHVWEGDVNEAVVAEWKAETTTYERVRQVIDVTTEPQPVSTIAERAQVSEPTARKHLSTQVESGRVKAVESEGGTRYKRAPQLLALQRISAIHREHSKADIRAIIEEFKEELRELREQYDVTDVDELTFELDTGDDGWRDVARWQQVEQNLDVARAALALYDFDPDDSQSTREQGALGDDFAGTDSTRVRDAGWARRRRGIR